MLSPLLGRRAAPRPTAALGSLVAALDFPPQAWAADGVPEENGSLGPSHEAPQRVSFFAASSCLVVHMLGCRHNMNPGPPGESTVQSGDALSLHGPALSVV